MACPVPGGYVGGAVHGAPNRYELNTLLPFGAAGVPGLGRNADPADLTDIVPILLTLLGLPAPSTMTRRLRR